MRPLILASQSPRRSDLLSLMGFKFDTIAADVDESALANESPSQLVSRLAQLKAQTVLKRPINETLNDQVVIAADTIVVVGDEVLGKPVDFEHFLCMMRLLSARTHKVMTAVCVSNIGKSKSALVSTDVKFSRLSDTDIERYWSSGEPKDKAGGYGIQGIGGQFVSMIHGSYSAVVGLPMVETKQVLSEFGVSQ